MRGKLFMQASIKFLMGIIVVGLLIFLSAGTIYYWNAWVFIGVLFIPMLFMGIVLLLKAPELLEKRLNTEEKETEQKRVVGLSSLMFVGGFVVAGLDFRYGWSDLPDKISVAAAIIFFIGYILFAEVMRENAYLSRIVEVQKGQKVVDTGLYGLVRHPMYFATVLMFLSIPLILGSAYSLIIFMLYPFLLIKRIKNEETVLTQELAGYEEYIKKVRYRLIPFIW